MKGFGDFRRVAVVIVPEEDTYKERQEKHTTDSKHNASDQSLNEMKGKKIKLNPNVYVNGEINTFILQLISHFHRLNPVGLMRSFSLNWTANRRKRKSKNSMKKERKRSKNAINAIVATVVTIIIVEVIEN